VLKLRCCRTEQGRMTASPQPISDPDASWALLEGTHEGRPIFIRRNVAPAVLAGDRGRPYQVGVAVPFVEPDAQGLPGATDLERLGAFEDTLAAILCHGGVCLFAAVITCGGMREFVFYTHDPAAVQPRAEFIRDGFGTIDFQLMVQPDPDWAVYRALGEMAGPAAA
jgi:hypothetical protein